MLPGSTTILQNCLNFCNKLPSVCFVSVGFYKKVCKHFNLALTCVFSNPVIVLSDQLTLVYQFTPGFTCVMCLLMRLAIWSYVHCVCKYTCVCSFQAIHQIGMSMSLYVEKKGGGALFELSVLEVLQCTFSFSLLQIWPHVVKTTADCDLTAFLVHSHLNLNLTTSYYVTWDRL